MPRPPRRRPSTRVAAVGKIMHPRTTTKVRSQLPLREELIWLDSCPPARSAGMSADLVNRAEQLAAAGRWGEVAALLEPLSGNSASAGLWSMLAMARLRTDNHSGAADAFLRAASLDAE